MIIDKKVTQNKSSQSKHSDYCELSNDLHMSQMETRQFSKKETIGLIEKNFKGVDENGSICAIMNVEMSDGEIGQVITFGKRLEW
ncbi:hypothetical protein CWE04_11590 [Thomasclavelia cocleata]|uniref:Uncharacterized protein n=1 Tax=Thomasclavelia cocleata TaxID=69824 RepID=A0A1I0GC19_9FIRM|nr:hypothetical protein [Thomasclavelia cocleata]MCR1959833.1 hypothetical protein [Thomasclavelia cocleata]NDO43183.1 hypothetical protein [Thomasclavelia cocleata]PJN79845.1 hypothetical protein CWE04_11590 [Thomasclavelia cocleata]SET68316.1 hypothetical protein SAMN04489758_1288 [Thomasclavelia cocleata]